MTVPIAVLKILLTSASVGDGAVLHRVDIDARGEGVSEWLTIRGSNDPPRECVREYGPEPTSASSICLILVSQKTC